MTMCTNFGMFFSEYSDFHSKWTNFWAKMTQVLKLVLPELALYLMAYYSVNAMYRIMRNEQQETFRQVVNYLNSNLQNMSRDLTFLLGFYVTTVAKRWWDQFISIPDPDCLAINLTAVTIGDHPTASELKDEIMRYAMLSWLLCLRRFSPALKKRLPNLEQSEFFHNGDAISEEVMKQLHHRDSAGQLLWMIPLNWAANLVKRAKSRNVIGNDAKEIWRELNRFRNGLRTVENYNLVPVPFVYKTVVVFAVYSFFLLNIVGEQDIGSKHVDLYFPLFGVLKVIFFIGWLKVAISMENPLQADEVNFHLSGLLERHLRVGHVLIHDSQIEVVPLVHK